MAITVAWRTNDLPWCADRVVRIAGERGRLHAFSGHCWSQKGGIEDRTSDFGQSIQAAVKPAAWGQVEQVQVIR